MNASVRQSAINYTLERLAEIDDKYDTTSKKSSQWRKAANKVHKDLLAEDKDGNASISLNTYHGYLTAIRNAIKETGRKHPALTSSVNRKGYLAKAIRDLPAYESDLKSLASMPAETIGNGKNNLKEKIHSELKGNALDAAIDIVDGLLTDHPMVMMLTKSKARKEQRSKKESESLQAKSQHMKEYNFPAVLGLAQAMLEDDSYTALAWGLALLTGRRSAEVLYHAKLTKIDSNTVMFDGQLKKRQGTQTEAYPIPVLADADTIIAALKRLHSMPEVSKFRDGVVSLDGQEVFAEELRKRDLNRAINQGTNGVLNERAKRLMKDEAEVFKNTRGIYARYCSDKVRPESEQWKAFNEDEFLKAILGHQSTDEVKHYRQVTLSFDDTGDWLKVAEAKPEKEVETEDQTKAKRNWRATAGIKEMGESIEAYGDRFVEMPARKVSISKVHDFHFSQLRFWTAENPNLKITQTAVTKNKGNTLESGTGSVDLKANRYTFQAWLQVVGADNVEAFNVGKE